MHRSQDLSPLTFDDFSALVHNPKTTPAVVLEAVRKWWSNFLNCNPYFDELFYVGLNVAGYELGLLPDASPADGAPIYWGVDDVPAVVEASLVAGAIGHSPATDVGGGIVTATVRTPQSVIVGFIYYPHFSLD